LINFTDGAITLDSKVRARSSSRKAGESVTSAAILRPAKTLNRLGPMSRRGGRVKI
jgi:hypothetical protein